MRVDFVTFFSVRMPGVILVNAGTTSTYLTILECIIVESHSVYLFICPSITFTLLRVKGNNLSNNAR